MAAIGLMNRRIAFLERNVNVRFDEVTSLLRQMNGGPISSTRGGTDGSSSGSGSKRRLIYQKETPCREMPDHEGDVAQECIDVGDKNSLLQSQGSKHSSPHGSVHAIPSAAILACRLLSKTTSRIRNHSPQSSKSLTREPTQESPREYSELTTTYDYEELKSSTLSTDDEDTTSGMGGTTSLALTVMSNLNRATSLQLPEPEPSESRGVLRQTVSDSKEPDPGWESDPLTDAGSDTQV